MLRTCENSAAQLTRKRCPERGALPATAMLTLTPGSVALGLDALDAPAAGAGIALVAGGHQTCRYP